MLKRKKKCKKNHNNYNIFTLCKYRNTYPVLTNQAWQTEWAQLYSRSTRRIIPYTIFLTDKTEMIAIKRTQSPKDECGGSTSSVILSLFLDDKNIEREAYKLSLQYDMLVIQQTGNHHIYKLFKVGKHFYSPRHLFLSIQVHNIAFFCAI